MAQMSEATRALMEEMRYDATPPPDKLDALRAEVARLRDKEIELVEREAYIAELEGEIRVSKEQTLVDLFDSAGCNSIGIEAHGNLPAYDVKLADYYKAVIPKETEQEAFDYLRSVGSEDLIKTTFSISFGLREAKATEKFAELLRKSGVEYSVKQNVPWNTLTAWFEIEYKKKPLPQRAMDVLGAVTGRIAKVIKQRKGK